MIGRHRRSVAAAKAQTRAYAARIGELIPALRREIPAPEVPLGTPVAVLLMGLPGAGKSHCARLLCGRLGAACVSSDQLRSRLFIAATYTEEENGCVFRAADALLALLLTEGHRVVLDATNLLARNRAAATETARRRGVPLVHVRVVAEQADLVARLAGRRVARAPDDHSDADLSVLRRIERRAHTFEPPEGGHLELRNGPDLAAEIERVATAVERACVPAS